MEYFKAYMGFPQIRSTCLAVFLISKDESIFGSILGPPFGETILCSLVLIALRANYNVA